jgi:hypothetical protein
MTFCFRDPAPQGDTLNSSWDGMTDLRQRLIVFNLPTDSAVHVKCKAKIYVVLY